jgi:hypothetical protein
MGFVKVYRLREICAGAGLAVLEQVAMVRGLWIEILQQKTGPRKLILEPLHFSRSLGKYVGDGQGGWIGRRSW